MDEYKKELEKALKEYFDKEYEITKNMSPEEEKKYIEENKKEQEIKDIYEKLQKKYNIKFDGTQK